MYQRLLASLRGLKIFSLAAFEALTSIDAVSCDIRGIQIALLFSRQASVFDNQ